MKGKIRIVEHSIMIGMIKNSFPKKFVFTIFGASGDLADLKIFPALFELYENGRFEDDFWIIGYARSEISQNEFKEKFRNSIVNFLKKNNRQADDEKLEAILKRVSYYQGKYDKKISFEAYRKFVYEMTNGDYAEELFHFSVPPSAYCKIIQLIHEVSSKEERDRVKLIIEKPFGEDYKSALTLETLIKELFCEDQVYLIDHYLGKHAVRSILSLRENNKVLNMLLSGTEIANIQVSALEKLGVENRLSYYDQVGATKDMLQSHLIQLLSLVMIELPAVLSNKSIKSVKDYFVENLIFEKAVFGQYEDYCENLEYTCSPATDTYFAGKFLFNNNNWFNVPIFLRSGKSMNRKQTSVVVEFKKYEHQGVEIPRNKMIIEIAPNPSIKLYLVNENGYESKVQDIVTAESLHCGEDDCMSSHAVLFLDALLDKKMFFVSFRQALCSWKLTEKVLKDKVIEKYPVGVPYFEASDELIKLDGFKWTNTDA
jgi:glucose-6-phosphate 1-dehydrogenase